MKFPSLYRLTSEAKNVIVKFPLAVLFAFTGCCAATALIELEPSNLEYSNWCWKLIMTCNLGLLLSLSAAFFSEGRAHTAKNKIILQAIAFLFSCISLLVFEPLHRESDIVRFLLLSFSFHLLVSFAAFLSRRTAITAFWQFNKTLFLRLLAGALYSLVLFLGLCAALGAMNLLFGFDFKSDTFQIMGVWIAGLFQTLFFLAGMPLYPEILQPDNSYPKGLKLFTQYALIPLATIYALILLSYEMKILIEWNIPKGIVASLILSYAVFGILSLLLVYPLRDTEENKWIKTYSRSFYFLMVPLIVLLYLAILLRVRNYGITEERYFLILLALWLSFITFFFLFTKKQNILVIPLSLSLVTFIAVYGPLSAFSIAERSQLHQLNLLLEKNKALKNGKMSVLPANIPRDDKNRISSVTHYMMDNYGLRSFQPLISRDLKQVEDSIKTVLTDKKQGRGSYNRWERNQLQLSWLHKNYNLPDSYRDISEPAHRYKLIAEDQELIPVSGFDYIVHIESYQNTVQSVKPGKGPELYYSTNNSEISLRVEDEKIKIRIEDIIKSSTRLGKKTGDTGAEVANEDKDVLIVPRTLLSRNLRLGVYDLRIVLNHITYTGDGKNNIDNISAGGTVLFKKVR